MNTVTMTFSRSEAVATAESLLWKYGSAIEGADNYRQVYNTESSVAADTVDAKVMHDAWQSRVMEAFHHVLNDFGRVATQSEGSKTIVLSMPDRWNGTPDTLKSLIDQYIVDGIMSDWLSVTSPSESAVFGGRLADDITLIKLELYSKGAPQ